ncbi:hypothetical protein Hanom_Chr06g00495601 [Helianthus anomalus]
MRDFEFWTKMTTKCKPQGPKLKKFEIWTKMAKLPKPQGPKWQLLVIINFILRIVRKHYRVTSNLICVYGCYYLRVYVY